MAGEIRFYMLKRRGYRAVLAALAGELAPLHWTISVDHSFAMVEIALEGPVSTHEQAAEIVERALPGLQPLADRHLKPTRIASF